MHLLEQDLLRYLVSSKVILGDIGSSEISREISLSYLEQDFIVHHLRQEISSRPITTSSWAKDLPKKSCLGQRYAILSRAKILLRGLVFVIKSEISWERSHPKQNLSRHVKSSLERCQIKLDILRDLSISTHWSIYILISKFIDWEIQINHRITKQYDPVFVQTTQTTCNEQYPIQIVNLKSIPKATRTWTTHFPWAILCWADCTCRLDIANLDTNCT